MFGVVTIPIIIGMIIRKLFGNFIVKNMNIIQIISIGLFSLVLLLFILRNGIALLCLSKLQEL